ncbi:MAG: homing endonuclease associated repeat-containing protein [Terriglobales bacterium]
MRGVIPDWSHPVTNVFHYEEQAVSKEEILEAIKKMAEELGRAPSLPELRDKSGISPRQGPQKLFDVYRRAQSMRPGTRRRRIHHADGCAV